MSLLETARKIVEEFDRRQDIPLTTRIMAHGNESIGVLREMLKEPKGSTTLEARLRLAEAALTKNGFTKLDDTWVAPSNEEEERHQDDVANHRNTWLAVALHYPECWDTAAYPTLDSAVTEVMHAFSCEEEHCKQFPFEKRGRPLILKGVGKVNGDGWKDTTKVGEVVLVWNQEKPEPFKPGQYPRLGNPGWTASGEQYDFSVATPQDIEAALFPAPTPQNVIKDLHRVMRRAVEADILFRVDLVSHTKGMGHLFMQADFRPRRHDLKYLPNGDPDWDSQYNPKTRVAIQQGLSDG